MTKFYPLYVRRSDGKREIAAKGKRTEINQPTDEQLDQKPDANGVSDFYREVGMEEPKHLDWRRKLGGMLARELDWKDQNSQPAGDAGYILVTFPEHYRLYEHVKKTEKDGKTEVKSKTHAAGGNDRQDAYLYGHPAGRKKRYRSPADFFPHLLWLCTDESGDPDNCSCKICSPDDLDELIPGAKAKSAQAAPSGAVKTEAGTAANVMVRQGSGQDMTKIKQEARSVTPAQPPQLSPSPLPQPKTHDQQIDQTYNTFVYRPGELVWFSRGQAWGLGAVLRRWRQGNNQNHYTVQPLSHPFSHPRPAVKTPDSELRPWLAWSVPAYTNEALNNMSESPDYYTIDFNGMMQKKYGNGDPEVDGSILAAKTVDCSYTLFSKIRSVEVEPVVNETFYDGVYLGAEKIWIGDPLRLQPQQDILVLQSIIERRAVASEEHQIYLVGDIYQLQQIRHTNPMTPTPASAASNQQLPPRLTQDLTFRNERAIAAKGIASFWKLIRTAARVEINQIKGRWYEASLILPILQETVFHEAARKGEIAEATLWMNARGDCVNANRAPNLPHLPRKDVYRPTRRQAFGRAMPPNAEIKEGIEPPSLAVNVDPALQGMASQSSVSMDIDPRFETAENNTTSSDKIHVSHTAPVDDRLNGGGALDELMNLDGMDEHGHTDMPEFAQQYSHQGAQQRYY